MNKAGGISSGFVFLRETLLEKNVYVCKKRNKNSGIFHKKNGITKLSSVSFAQMSIDKPVGVSYNVK